MALRVDRSAVFIGFAAEIDVVCFDCQPVERPEAGDDLEAVVIERSSLPKLVDSVEFGLGDAGAEIEAVVGSGRLRGRWRRATSAPSAAIAANFMFMRDLSRVLGRSD